MRVVEVEVLGKKYDLVFSNRVLMRLEEKKLDTKSTLGTLSMLSYMMEAGDWLARHEGRPGKGFLDVDTMADLLTPADIISLMTPMDEAQQGERNVETVEDAKNGESTPSAG